MALAVEPFGQYRIEATLNCGNGSRLNINKPYVPRILVELTNIAMDADSPLCPQSGIESKLAGKRECILISDKVIGIAAKSLTKVFLHRFAARPNGHHFRHHRSALAVAQMRRRLLADNSSSGLRVRCMLGLPLHRSPR